MSANASGHSAAPWGHWEGPEDEVCAVSEHIKHPQTSNGLVHQGP